MRPGVLAAIAGSHGLEPGDSPYGRIAAMVIGFEASRHTSPRPYGDSHIG